MDVNQITYKHLFLKIIIGFCCYFITLLPTTVKTYANGGPVDSNGLVEGGNIKFMKVDDITLKEEKLDIIIDRDYIHVNVEYVLANEGEERNIEYAFPILKWIEEHGNGSAFIDNIKMRDGDIDLEYRVIETDMDKEIIEERFKGEFGITKYECLYSQLNFDKNEIKRLNISYRTKSMFLDWGISNTFLVRGISDNYFSYDLSPASNWGDGMVDLFTVNVDYSDLLKVDGYIIDTNLMNFNTDNKEGFYRYTVEDFYFKKQPLIEIRYSNKDYREEKHMETMRLATGVLKEVKVSSILKEQGQYDYYSQNLFDNDMDTCWAEGSEGYGVGDTIELNFDKEVSIAGIALINGYTRDENTYSDNARIKELKVEHVDENQETVLEIKRTFDDMSYDQLDKNSIYDSMQVLDDLGDGYMLGNSNKRIRLTILDVYPGKKYEDTCISEILLFGFLPKESRYPEDVDYFIDPTQELNTTTDLTETGEMDEQVEDVGKPIDSHENELESDDLESAREDRSGSKDDSDARSDSHTDSDTEADNDINTKIHIPLFTCLILIIVIFMNRANNYRIRNKRSGR